MDKMHKKNFGLYASGRLISLLGDTIQMIAFPLLILDISNSAKIMGFVTILLFVFDILVRPFTGVIGDKFNRKTLVISTDIISGIMCFMMYFVAQNKMLSLSVVIIYMFFQTIISCLFDSADYGMFTELVPEDGFVKANSIMSIISNISSIIGPVIGAALYGFLGIGILLFINGISFIISAVLAILIKYESKNIQEEDERINMIEDIKEGFKFLVSNSKLKYLLNVIIINSMFALPIISTFLPVMLKRDAGFNSSYIGIAESIISIGSLIGGMLFVFIKNNQNNKTIFKISYLIVNLSFLFMGITLMFNIHNKILHFALLVPFIILNGLSTLASNVLVSSRFQEETPNELMSRVGSFRMIIMQLAGMVSVGIAGIAMDIVPSYVYIAILCAVNFLFLIFYIYPGFEKLNKEEQE